MTTLYLVRHGEVHNPEGIIYGRLPGFGLSEAGRRQLAAAAELLAGEGPLAALYASPMQRAQESAAIIAARLGMAVETAEPLVETSIGGYQGRPFSDLPRPYITETPTHAGIECAASIRSRLLGWAEDASRRHPDARFVAVSHRDPIAVVLLHWQGKGLDELPGYPLAPGAVNRIEFGAGPARVTPLA